MVFNPPVIPAETPVQLAARLELARLKALPLEERPAIYLTPTDRHNLNVLIVAKLIARIEALERAVEDLKAKPVL